MHVDLLFCFKLEDDYEKQVWLNWSIQPTLMQRRGNRLHPFEQLPSQDMRHSAVIRQSVIKRENPELRIHNAIPCDLVFTGAAVDVCACTNGRPHTSLCVRKGPSQTLSTAPIPRLWVHTPASSCLLLQTYLTFLWALSGGRGDRRCLAFWGDQFSKHFHFWFTQRWHTSPTTCPKNGLPYVLTHLLCY